MKIFYFLFVFVFLSVGNIFSQGTTAKIFNIDSLPVQGILLNNGWKFHSGDNPGWANPNLDDSKWTDIDPTAELYYLPEVTKEQVGWFRIHLHINSSLLKLPLSFQVYQTLATEIFLNGQLEKKYGVIGASQKDTKAYQPVNAPEGMFFSQQDEVIAIRFSAQHDLPYFEFSVAPFYAFRLRITSVRNAFLVHDSRTLNYNINYLVAGLFLIIAVFHFCFYLFHKRQKANIYFSISSLFGGLSRVLFVSIFSITSISVKVFAALLDWIMLFTLHGIFLYIAIWHIFSRRKGFQFWVLMIYSLFGLLMLFQFYKMGWFWGTVITYFLCLIESLRMAIVARRNGRKSASIIIAGLFSCFVFFLSFMMLVFKILPDVAILRGLTASEILYQLSAIAVPISLSIYLSREFASTSKELEKKLTEVELLSAKSILQEKEKLRMIATQNERLEKNVSERTSELRQSLEELKSTQTQLIQSEKMASLGELTAGVAHEIQNPLNFVNNFSEVNTELIDELKSELATGNTQQAIDIADNLKDNEEKIVFHGKRADAIVKGMLQHSRSSSGVKEPTDINALADEYLRLAYHGLRAKDKSFNATMKTDYDDTIGNINIVSQDIGRVILNLITNAFYAVTEKQKENVPGYEPTVTISTKRSLSFGEGRGEVQVKVKDNGKGISQKVLDKIFQPFFTTKPTGQGTGLGLSLAYDIIKTHGGEIKVETREGGGSEFIVSLPA